MSLPNMQQWGRAGLRMLIVELGLALAFAAIAGAMLYQERVEAKAHAVQQADNIASALQRDLERDVETLDLALRSAAAGMQLLEQQPLAPKLQRAILFDAALSSADFGALFIADANGDVIFDSASETARSFNVRDSPAFQAHRADPDSGLLLSLVPHSAINNLPVVVLTRRVDHLDGSFAGVAAASLRLSLFKDLFGALQLGPRDNVVALTSAGQLIYRRTTGTANFGADLTASDVFQATRGPQKIVETRSLTDGVLRLHAHHPLRNVGMEVAVGLSVDDAYAGWRREAWILGSTLVGLLVLALLLAIGARRELLRREQAEIAVRTSERNFRLLADHGGDMVCRVGPDGERRYISPVSVRMLGLPPELLNSAKMLELSHPADRPQMQALAAALLKGGSESETMEFRIRHQDGGERWIEAVGCTLKDPLTGELDGYVSAWRDVTDRKLAETLLAESEARYRLLADNSTDLITCLDMDLRRTYASPASLKVLGFEPAEMVGVCLSDVLHSDDSLEVQGSFQRLTTGVSDQEVVTTRSRHKDGHYVWVEAQMSLLRDRESGEPFSILCMLRDVSERKAAADELQAVNGELQRLSRHLARARDAAEQASRAKSRFLASVSHELRTPLNGILGYAELLRLDGGLSSTQAARVEAMLAAGSHLLNMVTSVLDLSEIEAGKVDLRPTSLALEPLAAECLEVVRPAADAKGLTLTLRSELGVPSEIRTDPTRLRQILLNLLSNAIKFTDRGGASLILHAAGAGLRIEVMDTGPGIPASRRDRLFQDFDRLGIDAVRSVEGAGLGLALSHRLAIALGGVLEHEDNPAGGSIFSLELPGCRAEAASPSSAQPVVEDLALPARFWRALVVDDMAINRDIAASFLRAAGHDCVCADGGLGAVEAAGASDFDVILMDVRMPEVDGLEAARCIRRLEGARGKVPIVAVTAQVFAEEVAACKAAGMHDHLAKPFNQAALLKVVERAVRGASGTVAGGDDGASREEPPSPPLLVGSDLVTLDRAAMEQTAAYLPEDRLASHLHSLADRTAGLLERVRGMEGEGEGEGEADAVVGRRLAAEAHAVSGSASMFGFIRLAAVAREFEVAVYAGSTDAALTTGLMAACETALVEMRHRATEPVGAADSQMVVTEA